MTEGPTNGAARSAGAEGHRLDELARQVGGRVVGDGARVIRGVATLEQAGPDELSFLTNPRYREAARTTRAGALLVRPGGGPAGATLLEADEPYLALARLLELFHPVPAPAPGVSPLAHLGAGVRLGSGVRIEPFAVVGDGAMLADGVIVGAGSVVGEGCRIGEATRVMPRVVLYPGTEVGRRCLLHAGVVLGADGFGFATSAGRHHKVPQLGRVVVGDDVELGANTTVDRGTLGRTVVGEGSKIDNLVMIAHGVELGPGCLIAAQSGIAGSTRVGSRVTFAGQSGAAGHLQIADGTIVAAKSAVLEDVPQRAFLAGIPAVDHRAWKRSQALVRRLPELRRRLLELERRLGARVSEASEED